MIYCKEKGKRVEGMMVVKVRRLKLFAVFFMLLATLPVFASEEPKPEEQAVAGQALDSSVNETSQTELDEAIELAREKVKVDPSSAANQTSLGYLLLEKGSLEEAGKSFEHALSANERFHDALTGKGVVLVRMGRDKEAEEFLTRALSLNPNPVRTYYELGLLYEKRGDYAQAVKQFKMGIEKYKQGRR